MSLLFFPKDYSRATLGTNFSERFTGTLTNRHLSQNSEKRLCKCLYVGDVVKSHLQICFCQLAHPLHHIILGGCQVTADKTKEVYLEGLRHTRIRANKFLLYAKFYISIKKSCLLKQTTDKLNARVVPCPVTRLGLHFVVKQYNNMKCFVIPPDSKI